jgi:hypothetical protein
MIQVRKEYTKATCVKDMSKLNGRVSSSIYEESFPQIGKTYKIDSIFLMNEKRDEKGRCIPNNPWDIGFDILKVHLFGWKSQEDIFEEQEGFDYNSFIYYDDSDKIYQYFKDRGLNIRVPSFKDDLDEIYRKGSWRDKPVKSLSFHISDASKFSPEAKAFGKMMRQEMSKGGRYYDKPYHGLEVRGGFVLEENKSIIKPTTLSSVDSFLD